MTPPRLILLADSTLVPLWISRLARRLASLDHARVAAISSLNLPPSPRGLLDLFLALDGRLQRGAPDLFAPSDLTAALPNTPVVPPSELSSHPHDILLSFSSVQDFSSLRGASEASDEAISSSARGLLRRDDRPPRNDGTRNSWNQIPNFPHPPRLGIWTWNSLAPSTGFREVLAREPLMTCDLLAILPSGETKLLRRAVFATDWISAARNRNHFFIKAESTLLWALKKLALEGESGAHSLPALHRSLETSESAPASGAQSLPALHIASLALKQTARKIEKYLRPRETWLLLAAKTPAGLLPELDRSRPIVPPRGVYWADPMMVERDGRLHVFVEEYVRETRRGRIVCLMLEDGKVASRQAALERPYHLSYPFVFAWRGEMWMIPETSAQRTVELYRCARWPDRWEFAHNLMNDVYAVDSTLLEHGGRWWLFTNLKSEAGASSWDELHLFFADEPTSARWTPHPLNPVISDVRTARPAGRLFEFEGRLYRPSQDCSVRYGYALNFNRVETLTERDYEETRVETIRPRPGMRTLHTFARAGGWDIVDGATRSKIVDK
jgi:hypothetical protein